MYRALVVITSRVIVFTLGALVVLLLVNLKAV